MNYISVFSIFITIQANGLRRRGVIEILKVYPVILMISKPVFYEDIIPAHPGVDYENIKNHHSNIYERNGSL
jgi:hypothetical protein